ncbi:MAG: hypothetical protein C0439_15645 [Pseudomonas sp.]|nr:hypothetical protein [Pseudomonas sp.]
MVEMSSKAVETNATLNLRRRVGKTMNRCLHASMAGLAAGLPTAAMCRSEGQGDELILCCLNVQ